MDEAIRNSFSRVKEDILFLGTEVSNLKYELLEIRSMLESIHEQMNAEKLQKLSNNRQVPPINTNIVSLSPNMPNPTLQQTIQQINPIEADKPTDKQTVPQEIGGLKEPIKLSSTGNEGVPTNQQTYIQTNQQTNLQRENIEENLKKASVILDSLDSLKKEIRQKFKRLTSQEMAVFSVVYQLSEQDPENCTYKKIAENLRLSESSIRDYVLKIIDKGIPLKKNKIDNKKVILSVSNELKKVATLSTIIQLREL